MEARKIEPSPSLRRFGQEAGFVEAVESDRVAVRTRGGVRTAARAPSCLVAPRAGDKVLLALSDDGHEAYVLAILARTDGDTQTTIAVDGDLRLEAKRGAIDVMAESGIRLATRGEIDAAAERIRMRAEDAKVFFTSMAYVGRELVARTQVAKVAGTMLDGAWSTITQNAARIYRNVLEGEFVRAGTVDVRCDNSLGMHAENSSITATKVMKMNAGQILMG